MLESHNKKCSHSHCLSLYNINIGNNKKYLYRVKLVNDKSTVINKGLEIKNTTVETRIKEPKL